MRDTAAADLRLLRWYRGSVNSANGIYRDVASLDIETLAPRVTFLLDSEPPLPVDAGLLLSGISSLSEALKEKYPPLKITSPRVGSC